MKCNELINTNNVVTAATGATALYLLSKAFLAIVRSPSYSPDSKNFARLSTDSFYTASVKESVPGELSRLLTSLSPILDDDTKRMTLRNITQCIYLNESEASGCTIDDINLVTSFLEDKDKETKTETLNALKAFTATWKFKIKIQESIPKIIEIVTSIWDDSLQIAGLKLLNGLHIPDETHVLLRPQLTNFMDILLTGNASTKVQDLKFLGALIEKEDLLYDIMNCQAPADFLNLFHTSQPGNLLYEMLVFVERLSEARQSPQYQSMQWDFNKGSLHEVIFGDNSRLAERLLALVVHHEEDVQTQACKVILSLKISKEESRISSGHTPSRSDVSAYPLESTRKSQIANGSPLNQTSIPTTDSLPVAPDSESRGSVPPSLGTNETNGSVQPLPDAKESRGSDHPSLGTNGSQASVHPLPDTKESRGSVPPSLGTNETNGSVQPLPDAKESHGSVHPSPGTNGSQASVHPVPGTNESRSSVHPSLGTNGSRASVHPVPGTNESRSSVHPSLGTNGSRASVHPVPGTNESRSSVHPSLGTNGSRASVHPVPGTNESRGSVHPSLGTNGSRASVHPVPGTNESRSSVHPSLGTNGSRASVHPVPGTNESRGSVHPSLGTNGSRASVHPVPGTNESRSSVHPSLGTNGSRGSIHPVPGTNESGSSFHPLPGANETSHGSFHPSLGTNETSGSFHPLSGTNDTGQSFHSLERADHSFHPLPNVSVASGEHVLDQPMDSFHTPPVAGADESNNSV
ncbi:serine-rich adhesin for platelets-like [Erythrolamprus reginae]|uniref:serine-rich adhesin for platelets-like n=1 Tax=Erythrolamprus reginae TaxID=121349 RepID=UPI00396CEDBC